MAVSMESQAFLEEFDFHRCLKLFVEGHNDGEFGIALKRHLKGFVPAVFKNPNEPDPAVEDRLSQKLIFSLFDRFICDGDPQEVYEYLKKLEAPPVLCAKVFKLGEPTYSCRDCGMDPTCVLCVDCFQNSTHKHHKYKMSTSSGGGYCDCGDSEAWKSDPFCDIHKPGHAQENELGSANDLLSPEMRARLEDLFHSLTEYILEILTWPDPIDLPSDLQCPIPPQGWSSTFITMLFNDEVHTYEQVTSALIKAINCNQTTAIDLATTVDREGRSVVKIGSRTDCDHVKRIIEQTTSRRMYSLGTDSIPLVVKIMSPFIVSHQSFATRAIVWLRQLLNNYTVLRELYAELSLKSGTSGPSFVERCMLSETKMWKSARIQTRQLFMTGIFMNPQLKREFAILYTKVYGQVMRVYVRDDHDHTYSVTSESVQIFTVPSLARMLIAEHDLLKIITDSLYHECSLKVANSKRVMSFDGQDSRFMRTHFAIYDLKYALLIRPEPQEWTEELRKNFIHGFESFISILTLMQGMDSNLRQVDTHIEYEQEWESGFNFQLRLVDVYQLLVEWCKSDENVLLESIRICVEAIKSLNNKAKSVETASVCSCSMDCYKMDFSTDPVSIHSPLTRLLASLLACHNNTPGTNTIDFVNYLSNQEKTDIKELLEPCLKAVVFVGQVNAGMWRRNGFSLQSQVYFYHNIKCRSTMFDRDVLFLQIAASIMPNNEFLIQLIHAFGLINWSKGEYDTESTPDDSMKQVISLAETFLNWLINIYCERYAIGVGEVTYSDIQRYEVIHSLCIQPMSHSELLDSVSCSTTSDKEKCIEDLVKEVATFKKPTSSLGKGLYELKNEFYSMYNPHFYHYTKTNRAKSEENVKKFLKNSGKSTAVHPPKTKLPEFLGMFRNIPQFLQCDIFIHVVRLVLTRSAARWSKSWSELQLEKILFLMEYALDEEKKRLENGDNSFEFVKKAVDASLSPSIIQIMENLLSHPSFAHNSLRDLVLSVYERLRELARGGGAVKMDEGSEMTQGLFTMGKDDGRKVSKSSNDKAKKRREKIMAQMFKMQRNFIKENQELFESTSTLNSFSESSMDQASPDECTSISGDVLMTHPVALGLKRSAAVSSVCRQTCILCQEDQDVIHNDKALVYCSFMQKSTVLSTDRSKPLIFKVPSDTDPLFCEANLSLGIYTSTCGHVMHADCWRSFFEALVQRETRRTRIRMPHTSFDVSKKEFLCPMCESISNTALPLISPLSMLAAKESNEKKVDLSLDEWLDGILKTVENSIKQEKDRESREESFFLVPCPLSTVTKMMAEGVAQRFQYIFDYMVDDNSSTFSDSIVEMLKKFASDVFEVSLDTYADTDDRLPVTLWNTCAYTIMSIENSLRDGEKPLFGSLPSKQAECMGTLIRLAAVSSNFFPGEVIKKHCIRLLSVLVCHSANPHDSDLLNIDLFHALVSVCLSLPTLYREGNSNDAAKNIVVPTGHVNESNLLQLVFSCHLLKIFLAIEVKDEVKTEGKEDPMETEENSIGEESLKICQHFRSLAGLPLTTMNHAEFLSHVNESCLPFLRCSSLFFHYLTGVPAPLKLFQNGKDEMEIICKYLDLPANFSLLFHNSKLMQNFLSSWCRDLGQSSDAEDLYVNRRQWQQPSSSQPSSSGAELTVQKVRYPRRVNQLLELPINYSDLINRSSMFSCPRSNSSEESRSPALCLICGTTVCSQSYCCQVKISNSRTTIGAAMAHSLTCGAGTGIFLRVRDCQVMLISGLDKGCFMPSPYLDEYGETDEGLRRGNPLNLCCDRYRHLQKMWLNHSIAGEVTHRIENPVHPQNMMTPVDFNHL